MIFSVIFWGEELTLFGFARGQCEKSFENHCVKAILTFHHSESLFIHVVVVTLLLLLMPVRSFTPHYCRASRSASHHAQSLCDVSHILHPLLHAHEAGVRFLCEMLFRLRTDLTRQ